MRLAYQILIWACLLCFSNCTTNDDRLSTDLINFPETASSIEGNFDFPVIEFENPTLDFGTIAAGKRITHSFNFTNTGNAPLLISGVHPSCGCTVASGWTKTAIKPGDGGVIDVVFDSTDRTGVQNKRIDISTNSRPSITKLFIKGNVIGPDFTIDDLK